MSDDSINIVQISLDESVFNDGPREEPVQRQVAYGRELHKVYPKARMILLICTGRTEAAPFREGNVEFLPVKGGRYARRMRIFRYLRAIHKTEPIDVITTQTIFDEAWIALLFGRLYGCRVVGQIHFDPFSEFAKRDVFGDSPAGRLRYWLGLRLMRGFFAIRVVGEGIKRGIERRQLAHNVQVIPVPVQMLYGSGNRNEPLAPCTAALEQKKRKTVLFVGRLCAQKNLFLWLRIASTIVKQTEDVNFVIVGEGSLRKPLEKECARLGLQEYVRFTGHVPYSQLSEIYAASDVFLLTSAYEGLGRVLVEAFSHGIPVIGPRITGVEDIVDEGKSGFLHPLEDADGFAASVLLLLRNPVVASEMGDAGRKIVHARFAPARLTSRWVNLLVSSRRSNPSWLLLPRRRCWKRWKQIGFSRHTLFRSLQYEAIEGLVLSGRTLDLGGGNAASYNAIISLPGNNVVSVNISKDIRPTVIADICGKLPFKSNIFDNIISLNTLEHIYEDNVALEEALRVLRPGGALHIIVPFLYRIHASPADYHRHTATWWYRYLSSFGIKDSVKIEPLVWDRASTGYSLWQQREMGRLLKGIITLPPIFSDFRSAKGDRLLNSSKAQKLLDVPLGYYIRGLKT